MGSWRTAQRQMRGLTPVAEVAAGLAADDTMVGLHVRTVFDAPRDDVTARTALGEEAVRAAERRTAEAHAVRAAAQRAEHARRVADLVREVEEVREHNEALQQQLSSQQRSSWLGWGGR